MQIFNRVCYYYIPLSEASLRMVISRPKLVGGILESDEKLFMVNCAVVGLETVLQLKVSNIILLKAYGKRYVYHTD
jgi:hypothetical protein